MRVKQIFSGCGYLLREGYKERVEKGEHGECILYSYMKIEE
jgi:hypothetical protein